MSVSIRCPHCSAGLKVYETKLGTQVRCPSCKERFTCTPPAIPSPADVDAPTALSTQSLAPITSQADARGDNGSHVNELLTGILAAAATAGLYYGAVLPYQHTKVGAMLAGGWVPVATLFLAFWAASILLFKFFKTRRQRSSLLFDVLPTEISPEIRPDNIEEFQRHIASLPVKPGTSFLMTRVLRGLDHFRIRRDPQIVSSQLAAQGETDAMTVDSSYSMVKVFIWAVPILGFIGTVLGIGDAVATFSASVNTATNLDTIKESLAGVTKGLGYAFDTTLIALVLSIFLMLPLHWLQKAEEGVLAAVADYCNEDFLIRLHAPAAESADPGAALRSVVDSLAESQREAMATWRDELATIGKRLAADVAGGWREAGTGMGQAFEKALGAAQATVVESLRAQYAQVGTWLTRLEEAGGRLHEQAAERWQAVQATGNEGLARAASAAGAVVGEMRAAGVELLKQQQLQHERAQAGLDGVVDALKGIGSGQAAGIAELCATVRSSFVAVQESTVAADRARAEQLTNDAQQHRASLEALRGEASGVGKALAAMEKAVRTDLQQVARSLADTAAANAEALRVVNDSLGGTIREFTAGLDRIGTAQAARLDVTLDMLRELHAGLHETVPATLQAQANALKASARESHELARVQRELTEQVAQLSTDRALAQALVELQRTLANLDRRLEGRPGRGFRFPFFGRNGGGA